MALVLPEGKGGSNKRRSPAFPNLLHTYSDGADMLQHLPLLEKYKARTSS
jgi:hypothetical protein